METVLDKIIQGLQQELGAGWNVTPKQVFDVVHYFDCQFGDAHFLTHSYGIYAEVDTQRIIKTEAELIKRML